jgi:hypothetical protein
MNRRVMTWLARGAFVALVALGTLIAAPQFAPARDCPDPSPGTCPPLTTGTGPGSCYQACLDLGWPDGGDCMGNGCCVCRM